MGWPPGQRNCPFFTICMVSIPAINFWALQNDLKPSIGSVTRLTARWSCSTMLFDVQTGVGIYVSNGRGVGTALVDGDLLRQTMQVDGSFQKAPGRSLISLGCKEEVDRMASFVNCAV